MTLEFLKNDTTKTPLSSSCLTRRTTFSQSYLRELTLSSSSLGLTQKSINKGFNIMDSCVYANVSHENDILKVPSLSKE